jgi:hypothetical protein
MTLKNILLVWLHEGVQGLELSKWSIVISWELDSQEGEEIIGLKLEES